MHRVKEKRKKEREEEARNKDRYFQVGVYNGCAGLHSIKYRRH
jgi:hypothetical protein